MLPALFLRPLAFLVSEKNRDTGNSDTEARPLFPNLFSSVIVKV